MIGSGTTVCPWLYYPVLVPFTCPLKFIEMTLGSAVL
jgi:hypothetical protein